MKVARTMLIAASAAALAVGSAFAADKPAKNDDPGFNKLDKNHDGSLSRTEAAGNPYLLKRFKQADRNGDGKLSRTEYLTVMTKKDLSTIKDKVTGDKKQSASGGTKAKKQSSAASGGTKSQ
jgi:hypothetical protein